MSKRKINGITVLADDIIQQSDAKHPTDQLLRRALRAEKEMLPRHKAAVVERVYTYFRWKGCLDPERTLNRQIRMAKELDADFRSHAGKIKSEILNKVVPKWCSDTMKVTREWLCQIQRPVTLWLRAPKAAGKGVEQLLKKDVQPAGEGCWRNSFRYFGRDDLFLTAPFRHGHFEIQDLSSQFVGNFCQVQPGEHWWDMCAGEGGKMLHLADLLQQKGCVWATDRAAWRLQRLKRRAARARVFNYQSAQWDGQSKIPFRKPFDGILVDAPCSGIGTWQRNPHARWTITLEDVKELAELQFALLDIAASRLKPGGKLIYSTCTMTRQETTRVQRRLEKAHPELEPWSWDGTRPALPDFCELPSRKPTNGFVIQPHIWKSNGMFVARWRKRNTDQNGAN
jgi:16S rRNA (cytosine967-C5)-methyltransferase